MNAETGSRPLVCIVDDDQAVREAIDGLLRSSGLSTLMHASLDEFRAAAAGTASCLLLDIQLPGQSGLDFLLAVNEDEFSIPIVLITGYGDVPLAVRAMKAGAIDILPKPFTDTQLLRAVEAGIEVGQERRRCHERSNDVHGRYRTLTSREREVMALVTAGLMNKQIAWQLSLSEVTVKIHRGNAMRKMRARSLPDLVRMATMVVPSPALDPAARPTRQATTH